MCRLAMALAAVIGGFWTAAPSVSADSPKVEITSPKEGDTVTSPCRLTAQITGGIPEGKHAWVLIKDKHNYFLMWPRPTVTASGKLTHGNVRMDTAGEWELHVVFADAAADAAFMAKGESGNFKGLDKLPKGAETIEIVTIKR